MPLGHRPAHAASNGIRLTGARLPVSSPLLTPRRPHLHQARRQSAPYRWSIRWSRCRPFRCRTQPALAPWWSCQAPRSARSQVAGRRHERPRMRTAEPKATGPYRVDGTTHVHIKVQATGAPTRGSSNETQKSAPYDGSRRSCLPDNRDEPRAASCCAAYARVVSIRRRPHHTSASDAGAMYRSAHAGEDDRPGH